MYITIGSIIYSYKNIHYFPSLKLYDLIKNKIEKNSVHSYQLKEFVKHSSNPLNNINIFQSCFLFQFLLHSNSLNLKRNTKYFLLINLLIR